MFNAARKPLRHSRVQLTRPLALPRWLLARFQGHSGLGRLAAGQVTDRSAGRDVTGRDGAGDPAREALDMAGQIPA